MTSLFLLLTLALIGAARQAPAPKRKPIPPKTVARRGMQPDAPYGAIQVGPALQVKNHHPLLIPTTGDAYPAWTFEHFKKVLLSAKPDEIIVLQFHGVPDEKHPWVNTPPAAFREYMTYSSRTVIARWRCAIYCNATTQRACLMIRCSRPDAVPDND